LDDQVLFTIFEYKISPIQRFPIGLWARIKYDLDDFLTYKQTDDTQVIVWYHRKFIEISNEIYITNLKQNEKDDIIMNLIDYFTEKWNIEEKPFVYRDYKEPEYLFVNKEKRNTKEQTIKKLINNKLVYNKRKLNELPGLIIKLSNSNEKFNLLNIEIYSNYEFMQAKAHFKDFHFLIESNKQIENYLLSLNNPNGHDLNDLLIIGNVYLENLVLIQEYSESIILILQSRLVDYYKSGNIFKYFLDKIDSELTKDPLSLVALNSYFPIINNGSKDLFHSKNKKISFIINDSFNSLLFIFTNSIANDHELTLLNRQNLTTNILDNIRLTNLNGIIIDLAIYLNEPMFTSKIKLNEIFGGCIFLIQLYDLKSLFYLNFKDQIVKSLDKSSIEQFFYLANEIILVQSRTKIELFYLKLNSVLAEQSFTSEIIHAICNTDKQLVHQHDVLIQETLILIVTKQNLFIFKIIDKKFKQLIKLDEQIESISLKRNLARVEFEFVISAVKNRFKTKKLLKMKEIQSFKVISDDGNQLGAELKLVASFEKKIKLNNSIIKIIDYFGNLILFTDSVKYYVYDTSNVIYRHFLIFNFFYFCFV